MHGDVQVSSEKGCSLNKWDTYDLLAQKVASHH